MDGGPTNEPRAYIKSHGMRFPKNPEIVRGQIRGALRDNEYEAKETIAALRTVRAGDTVMEVGAGIGYMSTLVATKRDVKAVHAFEANPHLIPYIRSVHEANDVTNATVTNAILGKRKGSANFYVRNKLTASSLDEMDGKGVERVERVDVLNANHVFDELEPNVLIADIEGAEVDLIPLLDLSRLRAAIIELHPQWIGPGGGNTIMRCFMDAGMAYYHRGSHGKVVAFRRNW